MEGEYYHGITIDFLRDFIFDLMKIGFKFFYIFRLNILLYSLLYDFFSFIFNFQLSIFNYFCPPFSRIVVFI